MIHDQMKQREATPLEIERMIELGAIERIDLGEEDGITYSLAEHQFHFFNGQIERGFCMTAKNFEIYPMSAALGEIYIVPVYVEEIELWAYSSR